MKSRPRCIIRLSLIIPRDRIQAKETQADQKVTQKKKIAKNKEQTTPSTSKTKWPTKKSANQPANKTFLGATPSASLNNGARTFKRLPRSTTSSVLPTQPLTKMRPVWKKNSHRN